MSNKPGNFSARPRIFRYLIYFVENLFLYEANDDAAVTLNVKCEKIQNKYIRQNYSWLANETRINY